MKSISNGISWLSRVIGAASYRFYWDDCFSRASSLAYTSLLALLPVAVLVFWVFNSFGIDESQIRGTLVLSKALPTGESQLLVDLQNQILDYLQGISRNINDKIKLLGPASIFVLVVTSIALLNTIESALNVVWRVSADFTIVSKIINFWAVITLGPLLFLVSIYWNAKVGGYLEENPTFLTSGLAVLEFFVPVTFLWIALTLLFFKLPAATVRLRDAAFGAFVAAILFEFVKRGFASYVSLSTTYSKLYGVLTTIPLFLLWLYVIWLVVLFGAELAYQSGSINVLKGLKKYATDLGEIGALLGLRILFVIGKRFEDGEKVPTESEIAIETGSDPVLVRTCLDTLTDGGLITAPDAKTHARSLLASPEKLTVGDVLKVFRSKKHQNSPTDTQGISFPTGSYLLEVFQRANNNEDESSEITKWPLKKLLRSLDSIE